VRNRSGLPLLVCLCAAFTTLLDQSSLNTAIPALRGSLGAGPATLQWIIAGYSLTFGLALVPAGRLGDAHGRRWLFAGGVALFTIAAVIAGTASDPWVVAVARLAQGAGAGTINPQVYGIIQDLYTGRARARALGAYATVGGIAGIIGPSLGGLVLDAAGDDPGWRLVLLFNVPFGLVTVPLAIRLLPGGRRPQARRTALDLPGLTLLGLVTLCLLLPFVLPGGQGPPAYAWVLAAAGLVVALGTWEIHYARSGRTPVLVPSLLTDRGFSLGTLAAMFQFGSSLSTTLVLVLHLQDGLGWSPLHTALVTLPSAAGFAVSSSQSWRLVSRHGRPSVTAALAGSSLAIAATIGVLHTASGAALGAGLTLTQLAMGVCGGLIISPNQALTLGRAPGAAAGLAGAFLQVSQRISATLATAAVTGLLVGASGPGAASASLAICLAMMLLSTTFSAFDTRRDVTETTPALTLSKL
jgi:MFS family permease